MPEEAVDASENLGESEINEVTFECAEDTDLNEEELDLNVQRKMSIRGINVATMRRLSPGSIDEAGQRMSTVYLPNSDSHVSNN